MTLEAFPSEYFSRHDNSNDTLFYQVPRKTVYIDDHTIASLSELLLELLPPGGTYLDLMSGWRSHIPDELQPAQVAGLGLNAQEMAENCQLDEFMVHDLSKEPSLPFGEQQFDAVLCTVSVQYLIKPIEVFREVNRVLKPGGVFIVTFSDRCFPRKTIAIWLATTATQHRALVTRYFEVSGNWTDTSTGSVIPKTKPPESSNSLHVVWARKSSGG